MKKILILASNPRKDLDLNCEIRDLKAAIKRNKDFIVEIEPAVQLEKLQSHFHEYHPYIVHFCGHGAGNEGLVVDRGKLLSNNALSGLFKIFGAEVECVLLNACTTEIQANAIGKYVPYVIGTSREILDRAAYLFSIGFYEALSYGETIERCYELGCNAIEIGLNKVKLLPEISETSRKFEVIDIEATSVGTEPLKIILKKNSALRNRKLSANIPTQFPETILKEVNRKDYYDNLRDVLKRFGQTTIETEKPISKFEYEQRQTFLNKVEEFWIEGFLKPSLYFNTAIDKSKGDSSQILRPLDNLEVIPVDIDSSYDELHQTDIMGQLGDGKTLLILGDPGSGKTIALLQLAERLIEQTQQDMTKPIPVVFNLSSWGQKQQPLTEWLIEELKEKYQVPKTWSEPWIENQQLTLLLDGLDEVKANCRNACVRAINKFVATHLETEIVVCSRVKDYEALAERLLLSSAICIQPLSKKQLSDFLKNADDSLLGLKTVIECDLEIAEFAQTPLILNMMTWTYQGWSVEQCQKQFRIAKDRLHNLFESYIDKNLERENKEAKYPKEKVLYWLSWLATTMVKESKIVFLIEKMQPILLESRSEKICYRTWNFVLGGLSVGLSSGLIFGLIYGVFSGLSIGLIFGSNSGLILGLVSGLMFGLSIGLVYGMISGLISGLIAGIITGLSKEVILFEQMSWSWQRTKSKIVRHVSFGLINGLYFGLFFGRIYGLISGLSVGLIYGLSVGLISGLSAGLINIEVKQRTFPNQGIQSSMKNSVRIGLSRGLMIGLILGMIGQISGRQIYVKAIAEILRQMRKDGLIEMWSEMGKNRLIYHQLMGTLSNMSENRVILGLALGLFSIMTNWTFAGLILGLMNGGATCIKHFNLRRILYRKGRIPWNYARFLDYASERLLMKKVGGGYIFYHRMLMEHFAQRH